MQKTYALFSTAANRKTLARLEETGETVFQFAPVETERIDTAKQAEIIENKLSEFDWIIFHDVFAVDYFVEILVENEIDLFELDAANVVAVGESVADRLRFSQLHADIIPPFVETETIVSELLNYSGEESLDGLKFLIPKGAGFESEIKEKLIDLGAEVTETEIFRAEFGEKNKTANLKALLKGGAFDEFIFSSPEDLFSMKTYLYPETLNECFSETKASGTDEVSMQMLRENHLRPGFFANR